MTVNTTRTMLRGRPDGQAARAVARRGTDAPYEARSTTPDEGIDAIAQALDDTWSPDPGMRIAAVDQLCPCRLKADYPQVWDRLLGMATDVDVKVRSHVFHVLGDGSPRTREAEVVQAMERMQHDPDPGLRRRARKLLATYRRTGRINIL